VTQRTSFAKMQRDRDKQAKAAAKRDRRRERQDEAGVVDNPEAILDSSGRELTPAELLDQVATVHAQYESGVIDFETFEDKKATLLSRLPVD
jgi:hypothetical protein